MFFPNTSQSSTSTTPTLQLKNDHSNASLGLENVHFFCLNSKCTTERTNATSSCSKMHSVNAALALEPLDLKPISAKHNDTESAQQIYHAYVLAQTHYLKLYGCRYPKDMFVLFINIPAYAKHYMRSLPYHRRSVRSLLFNWVKENLPEKLSVKQAVSASKVTSVLPSQASVAAYNAAETLKQLRYCDEAIDHEDPFTFTRVVRWNEAALPLFIRSRPLCLADIKRSNLKENKICLFVFFSGKDMLAFDWLPFVSRFYNYVVSYGAKPENRTPRSSKVNEINNNCLSLLCHSDL